MFPDPPRPGGKQPGDPKDLPPPETIRSCGMIFGGGTFLISVVFILIGGSDFNILVAVVSAAILVIYYRMDLKQNGDPKK